MNSNKGSNLIANNSRRNNNQLDSNNLKSGFHEDSHDTMNDDTSI